MPQSLWALLSASRHEKRECVKLSKHDFLYFCHRHRRIHSFQGALFIFIMFPYSGYLFTKHDIGSSFMLL